MDTSITNIKITTKNYDVWITPAQHAAIRKLYDRLEERPSFESFFLHAWQSIMQKKPMKPMLFRCLFIGAIC